MNKVALPSTDRIRLIVNADDLGIAPSINAGIGRAFQDGIVTSASMLVTMPYFEEAIREVVVPAKMPVGIHLSLTQGQCCAKPSDVPLLVDDAGTLRWSAAEIFRGKAKRRDPEAFHRQVRIEWEAQLRRAREYDVPFTHIDSHQHVHMVPSVHAIAAEVAPRFGLTKARLVRESLSPSMLWIRPMEVLRRNNLAKWAVIEMQRRNLTPALQTTDQFWGLIYSGILNKRALLDRIYRLAFGRSYEFGVHPGVPVPFNQNSTDPFHRFLASPSRQIELSALTDPEVRELIRERGVELISFREL